MRNIRDLSPLFPALSFVRILITNDDGLFFPAISILRKHLDSIAETYVAAPAQERSGTSNAITIYDDIYVNREDEKTLMVQGFPADCINVGLYGGFFSGPFDLVVSGINKGENMGQDIFYSGTVGGARHAFLHGIPAIAISSEYESTQEDFETAAAFLAGFIRDFHPKQKEKYLLNINYPAKKRPDTIKWTKLGRRSYRDTYTRDQHGEKTFLLNMSGSTMGYEEEEGTDFHSYYNGWISITPLSVDATNYTELERNTSVHK